MAHFVIEMLREVQYGRDSSPSALSAGSFVLTAGGRTPVSPQFTCGVWLQGRRAACGPEYRNRPADIFKRKTLWAK